MPRGIPRVQAVQTPGVQSEPADEALAPDLQAVVDAEVARKLKALRDADAKAQGNGSLPTQEEALAAVMADKTHRSVLSRNGWVTYQPDAVKKDANGFAVG